MRVGRRPGWYLCGHGVGIGLDRIHALCRQVELALQKQIELKSILVLVPLKDEVLSAKVDGLQYN